MPTEIDPSEMDAPISNSSAPKITEIDPSEMDSGAQGSLASTAGFGHALARTGRDIVGGVAGLGDIGYAAVPPIYHGIRSGLSAMGVDVGTPQDTSQMQPSVAAKAAYDAATNNAGLPQNNTQAIVDKASEFLTQAAAGAPLAGAVTQGAATEAPTATSLLGKTAESLSAPISASEALASTAPKTMGQAASVAGAGAGSEAAHQAFPESNAAPLLGALAGGASIPAAGSLISGAKEMIAPAASEIAKPIAQRALEYGIPLTRSQIGDSKFNQGLASVAEKMPLSGGAKFRETQQNAFNKAVASTFGEDADKITPDVVNNAYKNIGAKFNEVHSGLEVKVNDDILDKLNSIEEDAKYSITGDHFKIVQNNIDKFLGDIDKNGTVSGEKLNSLRSNLAKTLKNNRNDASPYLNHIHDLIMDAAIGNNPAAQKMLTEARFQYKNLKTIEPLVSKDTTGDVSPTLLTNAVRQSYRDFSRGAGGKLGDLARIGNAFLKEKIPNPSTPERQMMYKIAGGTGAALTGAAAPAAIAPAIGTGLAGLAAAKGFNVLNQSQKGVRGALSRPPVSNTRNYTPGLMNAFLKQ